MTGAIALGLAILLLVWFVIRASRIGKREPGLPPGPPTLPLLGNLHIFPTEFAHYKLTEWARRYGDIYSLKIGSGTAVVITSTAAVKELMDKRSATTADRPPSHMGNKITGGHNMVLAKYRVWRALRKTAHAILTPQGSARYLPIQKAEASQLMYDTLMTPQDFYNHVRRYSNSVILSILYGKRCPRYETRESTSFFHVQHLWEGALELGAHPPVDLLPILQWVPQRWAGWKRLCVEVRRLQRELYFGLLGECEERLAKGEENGCWIEEVIKQSEEFGLTRELIGYLGGVLIEGGSDTTSAFLQSLILALIAFPEAQRKAQEEMDRVVGEHRMPTLDDWEGLTYIKALVKETNRFRPVAPLAFPHSTLAVEEYRGYVIPKGSTIFVNIWGIFHDPEVFDNPEQFDPDRYLRTEYGTKKGVDERDWRHTLAFGFGRRICPGMHLANNSLVEPMDDNLWEMKMLNAMNLIWAFDFKHEVDPRTKANIPVDPSSYHKGILAIPKPFKCSITPRSKGKASIIKREFANAVGMFLKFEDSLEESERRWIQETRKL